MTSTASASPERSSVPPLSAASTANVASARQRARWLKALHEWHWVSAALCLLGMVLFSVTGITLNHASQIEARPEVTTRKATVPAPLLAPAQVIGQAIAQAAGGQGGGRDADAPPLPAPLRDWVRAELGVAVAGRAVEWSADEAYVSLPRPGGDAWLRIDLESGALEYERTDRGWISYLNDLHKGRHTGAAWRWFIDLFAVAALVFSITGLLIMKLHAANRPMTWPVTGLGVLIPLLLALVLMH